METKILWEYVNAFSAAYDVHRKRVMSRFSLSAVEVDVLLFLANNPDINTASDIVRKRKIAKSHVSLAVHSLMEKGYLSKSEDPSNKKIKHLFLTDESSEIVQYGLEQQRQFASFLLEGASETELEYVRQNLLRVLNRLKNYNPS